MKIFVSVILAALTIGALGLPVSAQTMNPSPSASTQGGGGAVPLIPENKKGAGGAAVLTQNGPDLMVTLQLPPNYPTDAQVGIYQGTCTQNGVAQTKGSAKYKIQPSPSDSKAVVKNLTIDSLSKSQYVIVVQGTPKLCGDVSHMLAPQKP